MDIPPCPDFMCRPVYGKFAAKGAWGHVASRGRNLTCRMEKPVLCKGSQEADTAGAAYEPHGKWRTEVFLFLLQRI